MIKKLTCIECPASCALSIDVENCKVVKVTGHKCPKGLEYAAAEIENPSRILTATVLAEGSGLKMVPVRTDKPIPKADLFKAMDVVKKVRISRPVKAGDVIVAGLLGSKVNVIATRSSP
jgi:CxxC motif-containing protein